MPEIKIKIDIDTREKIREQAKNDDRSLTKYLERGLKYLANIPGGYHTQTTSHLNTNANIIDLSALPEGTTIKTTTAKSSTNKLVYPRRNLIKEAYEKEGIFDGRVHSADEEPFTNEEYAEELKRSYPYCQTHPDFLTLKQYYDSFASSPEEIYEARERFVGLPHFYSLQAHEEAYLYQAFDFTPPEDEPTLDLITYITRLSQGGWYDNDTTPRIKHKQ